MKADHLPRKILLVGWDAADWKVIMPLVDTGKLPNLAKFLEEGICGNMATLQPVLSPMLWTSIATGKRAYKHGIYGFTEPDPVRGGIRPITNLSRKTKAVWNILNQSGLNTTVVGWWPSNPVEELSRGVMVSNDYQSAAGCDPKNWPLKPGTIHPARLEKILAELRFHPAELTEADLRPFLPGIAGMNREELDKVEQHPRVQSLLKIIADCTSIHSAATALIQNERWDFMAVYYDAIDHFGHGFMRYHPPRREHIDEWDFRLFNYCVEAGYRYHDMMLGTLLRLAGAQTTVILLSDHGFHPDHLRPSAIPHEPTGPAIEHRQFGIFAARGPGIKHDERIYGANLLDICPTLLHLLGLPVGEDMDGKVLLDIYDQEPAPIERIPSWDQVEGDHGMHPPDRQISSADSDAAVRRLVALGYITEPSEDQTRAIAETVRELDYHLAMAYIDGGIYNKAVEILERLCHEWPSEHRFALRLASCYQSLGKTGELRWLITNVIEHRVAEAGAASAALRSLNLDYSAAAASEKELLEKMPDAERQKYLRDRAELAAQASPDLFTLRYLEASADFAEKKYAEALARLEQLDTSYGARRSALVLRGEICQRLKRWEESLSAFTAALEIDPESPAPLLGLARTSLAMNDFEAAAGRARESIGLLFFQPRAHYIHGLALYRMGNWQEAEHAFLLCVRQAPLFSAGYRMLAEIARWQKGDIAEQAFYQFKVHETRRRLAEIREHKAAEARSGAPAARATPKLAEEPRLLPAVEAHPSALEGVPAAEIITVVSGLPRSGTSLMMRILEAVGIPPFTDNVRQADESNPRGYYEHEQTAALLFSADKSWVAQARGKAIKVVAPILAALPVRLKKPGSQPEPIHYRILFMERDMMEILASQQTMLRRLGKSSPAVENDADIAKAFQRQEVQAREWCASMGIHAMGVSFNALVHQPDDILPGIASFLGISGNLSAMRAHIDAALHRARA